MNEFKLLDVVNPKVDLPGDGIKSDQIGNIVEDFEEGSFLVEFADDAGRTLAMLDLKADDMDFARACESALGKDWLRPEEDEAWKDL